MKTLNESVLSAAERAQEKLIINAGQGEFPRRIGGACGVKEASGNETGVAEYKIREMREREKKQERNKERKEQNRNEVREQHQRN